MSGPEEFLGMPDAVFDRYLDTVVAAVDLACDGQVLSGWLLLRAALEEARAEWTEEDSQVSSLVQHYEGALSHFAREYGNQLLR